MAHAGQSNNKINPSINQCQPTNEKQPLPIPQHVIFKVATITFILRQYSQPTYLSDQLVDYIPNRPLRSASQQLLLTKPTQTVLAQCSFTSAAPNIWNSLPEHLRQCCDLETFRHRLKTYLFSSVYAA